jgi:hypothetical protein
MLTLVVQFDVFGQTPGDEARIKDLQGKEYLMPDFRSPLTGHHSLHYVASSQYESIVIRVITKQSGGESCAFTHQLDIYQSILRSLPFVQTFPTGKWLSPSSSLLVDSRSIISELFLLPLFSDHLRYNPRRHTSNQSPSSCPSDTSNTHVTILPGNRILAPACAASKGDTKRTRDSSLSFHNSIHSIYQR